MKRILIYKCDDCNIWARRDYKLLTDGKPICHICGKEMRKSWTTAPELLNMKETMRRMMQFNLNRKKNGRKRKRVSK